MSSAGVRWSDLINISKAGNELPIILRGCLQQTAINNSFLKTCPLFLPLLLGACMKSVTTKIKLKTPISVGSLLHAGVEWVFLRSSNALYKKRPLFCLGSEVAPYKKSHHSAGDGRCRFRWTDSSSGMICPGYHRSWPPACLCYLQFFLK